MAAAAKASLLCVISKPTYFDKCGVIADDGCENDANESTFRKLRCFDPDPFLVEPNQVINIEYKEENQFRLCPFLRAWCDAIENQVARTIAADPHKK